jgi:hypothetical protein
VDVLQNSKPIALDVLANDTDSDGGPKRITSTIQPGDGAVRVIGGGSGLTFAPAPAFCGLTSFSYSLNGGSSAAVWIRVSCRRQVRLAPGRLYAGPRTLTARVLCPTMFDSCRGVKVRVVAAPRRGPGKGVLVASGKAGRITGGSRTGVRLTMTQRGYGLLRDRNGLLRVLAITRSPQTGAVRQLRFADDPNLASDGRSPTAS